MTSSFRNILSGASVLSLLQIAASVCGFLRDRAFAISFPPGQDPLGIASIYIASFRFSDLLFQSFVISILSVILVPLLSSHLAKGEEKTAHQITQSICLFLSCTFGTVAILAAIFMPWLAPSLTHFTGESLELYISFARIAFVTNAIFVLGNTFGQYLIARRSFWFYGFPPILWALSTIAGILWLTPIIGNHGPIVGTIIGTLLFAIVRFIGAYRKGFRFSFPVAFFHPVFRTLGWLILPRMLALGSVQLQFLWFDRLGSGLGTGEVAINQFAFNFESLIPGFIGVAIAQSCFALFSEAAARGDGASFRRHRNHALLLTTALSVAGAIGLAFCVKIAAMLLGLTPEIIPAFSLQLLTYCLAAPFDSINHVLLRIFYAQHNTKIPAISSVLGSIAGIAVSAHFIESLGLQAIALGYLAVCIVQVAVLFTAATSRRIKKMFLRNAVEELPA